MGVGINLFTKTCRSIICLGTFPLQLKNINCIAPDLGWVRRDQLNKSWSYKHNSSIEFDKMLEMTSHRSLIWHMTELIGQFQRRVKFCVFRNFVFRISFRFRGRLWTMNENFASINEDFFPEKNFTSLSRSSGLDFPRRNRSRCPTRTSWRRRPPWPWSKQVRNRPNTSWTRSKNFQILKVFLQFV